MKRQTGDVHLCGGQFEVEALRKCHRVVPGRPRYPGPLLLDRPVVLVQRQPDVGLVLVPLKLKSNVRSVTFFKYPNNTMPYAIFPPTGNDGDMSGVVYFIKDTCYTAYRSLLTCYCIIVS